MFLKNKKYLFDGGSGQTLMEMGLETTGDLWSAQALLNENNHQMVLEMHKNFINAGSQLIVTSNFSVRRRLLKKYNLLDKFEFGINNVLNHKYFTRRATGYPGPGIIPSSGTNVYTTIQIKI